MTGFLDEMLERAVDSKSSLAELMRKCLILSYKLDINDFREWAEKELNGYDDWKALPEYRVQLAPSYGHFLGPFNASITNYPLPLQCIPEEYRDIVKAIYLMDSIGTIEAMVAKSDDDKGTLGVKWPPDIIAIVSNKILRGYALADAWISGSPAFLYEVLERVRNRVMQFVLEVQKLVGNVEGLQDKIIEEVKKPLTEKFQQIIVLGNNNGNIAGDQKQSKVNITNINKGNIDTLRYKLENHGLNNDQISDLIENLSKDTRDGNDGFGPRILKWIADFSTNIAQGVVQNVTMQSLPGVVDAIKQFLGV